MRYIGCQTYGGGMDLGLTQAGWELARRVEQPGGFGLAQCESNRHLLGDQWDSQAGVPASWEPLSGIDAVIGLPPCSGFSLMSVRVGSGGKRGDYRGVDAPVNSCHWALIEYAARVNDGEGPQLVAFESVQGAGRDTEKGGLSLMRRLRVHLEELTGQAYHLTHLFHNSASLGGACIRPRYFFVASRVPFGIETPRVERVPTMRDAIGDLALPTDTWDPRPYAEPANFWTADKRNPDGLVNGNQPREFNQRTTDHIRGTLAAGWRQGEQMINVAQRQYEATGTWPDGWDQREIDKALRTNFQGGMYQMGRWRPERASRVLSGAAMSGVVHPWLDRTFTYRECARLMGFPDCWNVESYTDRQDAVFGKAVTVQAGRFLGTWTKRALEGDPGKWFGIETDDRENTINATSDHKAVYNERTGAWEDSRSDSLRREMESRPA